MPTNADPVATASIEQWHAALDSLYDQIQIWTSDPDWLSQLGTPVEIKRNTITLHEDRSGPYDAEELILSYQGRHMKVRPKARWVVGADGRVDLIGTEGPFILLWDQARDGWFYLSDRDWMVQDLRLLDGPLFRRFAEMCLR